MDDEYRVVISSSIEEEMPRGAVTKFRRKEVALPRDEEKRPSELAMEWHRERVYVG